MPGDGPGGVDAETVGCPRVNRAAFRRAAALNGTGGGGKLRALSIPDNPAGHITTQAVDVPTLRYRLNSNH